MQNRLLSPLDEDYPDIEQGRKLIWGECEADFEGHAPIRLQPSGAFEGSSVENDRVINRWRPKIHRLVDQSNGMAREMGLRIAWDLKEDIYPCCPFLAVIDPPDQGRDMRRFVDEACHLLLQLLTREEIVELATWPDNRKPDSRDAFEWLERWGTMLPDEKGQFELWSCFLPGEALEKLFVYVHTLVFDYYLEILERHREWEAQFESGGIEEGNKLPVRKDLTFSWLPPRIIVGEMEIWLNMDTAPAVRDWAFDMISRFHSTFPQEKKDELIGLVLEADTLCTDPKFM